MLFFSKMQVILSQFLTFVIIVLKDIFLYIKNKEYKVFKGYGLHIYVGAFGSGKTSSMVRDAYEIALRYPQVTILTNMTLLNFPAHTKVVDLVNYSQIISSPGNTLILIDEISTVFNSRDWQKEGVPASLLGQLLQVRKNKKMMFSTAQVFDHVDKLIRDITFSVRDCRCYCGRWNIVTSYEGKDYAQRSDNVEKLPRVLKFYGFIQTDRIRNLYDTFEMVEKMKKTKYISDVEVLEKQGKVIELVKG